MKHIPLHSLVIIVRPLGTDFPSEINNKFEQHEVLSLNSIRQELSGEQERIDINKEIYDEINRRAHVKLKIGERVVIDAPNLKRSHRKQFVKIGEYYDVPIFYIVYNQSLKEKTDNIPDNQSLVQRHHQLFYNHENEILKGDNLAEVIDLRKEDFSSVKKPNEHTTINNLVKDKSLQGITVIGDVHGTLESMKTAINWARSRRHLIVFLGDILDYGPRSLDCVDLAYETVMRGEAVFIKGNHEQKIEKYLKDENDTKISEGSKITLNQLNKLTSEQKRQWTQRFHALIAHSRRHWVIDGYTICAHGGAEPDLFDITKKNLPSRSHLQYITMFGELDSNQPKNNDGTLNRIYSWVDRIPKDCVVIVGHSIRDYYQPFIEKNNKNGIAVFLDTGSGKGGTLSSCDLKFKEGKWVITNYNKH